MVQLLLFQNPQLNSSKSPTDTIVANNLLSSLPLPPPPQIIFYSREHDRIVNLGTFQGFLINMCVLKSQILNSEFMISNMRHIEQISTGIDLWLPTHNGNRNKFVNDYFGSIYRRHHHRI